MVIWIIWGTLVVATVFLIMGAHVTRKLSSFISTTLASAGILLCCLSLIAVAMASTPFWHMILLFYIELYLLFSAVLLVRQKNIAHFYTNIIALSLALAVGYSLFYFSLSSLLLSLFVLIGIVTILAMLELRVSLMRYRLKKYDYKKQSLSDLPTVSVCVPARNETYALAGCLDSILASDYPKLEIIVLDDCSQDNTSQLIKSFAHAGVRFIQGEPPKEGWLGRNQACDVLARESSGSFIVYVDVDTRLQSDTISKLIDYTLLKRLTMISVLPERRMRFQMSNILSPLRYFWQMIIPQFIHTPAATALWLIRRRKLLEIGGFSSVKGDIMPENRLARTFDLHGTYRYLIGGQNLGVYYAKKWKSLIETSMRISYPSLEKSPAVVLVVSLSLYLLTIVPYLTLLDALVMGSWTVFASISAGIVLSHMLLFGVYAFSVGYKGWFLAILLLPVTILQEIAIIIASMIGYEFNKISWKGRNICYPVLKHRQNS